MGVLFVPMPGNERFALKLATACDGELARLSVRRFPDEETYLRLETGLLDRNVAIVCTLDRPDSKFLPLVFAAATARELGARSVGLIAPYLPYLRQDRRFKEGEATTSALFARLVSKQVDWLLTVDPHLHRYSSLDEIYTIPSRVAQAAPALADWIRSNIERPLVIGPDVESEQWVTAVAAPSGAPFVVLQKQRFGDREVEISIPDLRPWLDRTPVLVDDIVSSARTLINTCRRITAAGLPQPVCLAVHAIFAEDAYRRLKEVSGRVVTTNTIAHESNAIEVEGLLAPQVVALAEGEPGLVSKDA